MRIWMATLARLVLAGVWAYVGIAKIADPAASVRAVQAYQLLPDALERGIGYGLPFLALALAALLLVGLAVRVCASVSAVLLVAVLVGLVSAAARGLRIGCGCFGGDGELATGQATSYPRDIVVAAVLLAVSVALVVWPATRFAADDAVRRSAAAGLAEERVGPRRGAQARRRQAELEQARVAAGQRRVRLAGALAGVLLVVATGVGIGVQAARVSGGPSPQAVSLADGVKLGRPGARVTIELYEDPMCKTCATFVRTAGPQLQAWISASTAAVKYYVVAFLDGQSPTRYPSRAAAAMYCAADAGRFQEYRDLVFANQPAPGSAGPTDARLISLGRRAGIDGPQYEAFSRCVMTKKYADFVSRISDRASQGGILATPTLLVDGHPVQRVTLEGVTAAVDAAV